VPPREGSGIYTPLSLPDEGLVGAVQVFLDEPGLRALARRNQRPGGTALFVAMMVAWIFTEVFAALPPAARAKLLELRALIFETAARTPGVGPLEEALRWGEPSYLTSQSKSGTMLRIHWKARRPDRCAMYVHCQTNLLEQYRSRYPDTFEFEGDRAVLVDIDRPLPKAALRDCIQLALTYRRS